MSSNVLTQEELAALKEESQRAPTTQELDLTNTDRTQRKNLARLERTLTRLLPAAETAFGQSLRARCDARPTPAELVGGTAARATLENSAAAIPLEIAGDPIGWLCLPAELCFCLVDRSFGGSLPPAPAEDEEQDGSWHPERTHLTGLERMTIWPVVERLVNHGLGDVFLAGAVRVGASANDPDPELPELDQALCGALELRVGELTFRVELLLRSGLDDRPAADSTASRRDALRARVVRASVELSSHLGNVDLTVGELLALQPGDVLRLDRNQSDLLPLLVETAPKFMARPLQRKGCFALQIETEIP